MNIKNDAWGKRVNDKLCPQKIFTDQFIGRHSTQQSTDVFSFASLYVTMTAVTSNSIRHKNITKKI